MASAMQPWSAIRLSDPCRQGSALRLCGSQSCSALTPAKGLPFKGGLQIGCTPKGGAFFQKHHCKGQDRSRRPELGHAPRSGLFSQQGKNTDRRRQGASAHEGKSSSDAIREEGPLGGQSNVSQDKSSPMAKGAADGQSEGQVGGPPEVELAMQQAQRQLDLFTEQLQGFADFDTSALSADQGLKPENLSSLGPGRGLWQAPSFSLGAGQGQDVPPELMEMLTGGEGKGDEESIFPEDRYFEEVSKEELKEILYGTGGFEKSFRGGKETAADFEHWGELWEGGAGRSSSNQSALSGDGPRTEEFRGGDISSNPKAGAPEPGQAEKAAPMQDGPNTTADAAATPSMGSETNAPRVNPSPTNEVPVPPLPPPRALQARIPPPPSPHPNLLPVSPLQRPSSWLSDSYPPAPRLPFTSGRPPLNGPTDTPPSQSPAAPQPPTPPAAPVYPLTGSPLRGASEQVPWPPVPPSPRSDVSSRPPLDQSKIPNGGAKPTGSSSVPGSFPSGNVGFPRTPFSVEPFRSDRVFESEGPPTLFRTPALNERSSPGWTSSSDTVSSLDGPPSFEEPPQSDGPASSDSPSVQFRETPQLQSEALRRLFAMSPEELHALDRQLATGGAQLQVTGGAALDLNAPGVQSAPTATPSEKEPAPRQSSPSIADVTADVSGERPVSKAKTLDDIIDELSTMTGDGKFGDFDAAAPGGGSVGDLLDRLKRLVDISEKAIGELAFGGGLPEGEEQRENSDADDSYEEPGTCMDDEYYGGSRGPREGTENVANLFADPVLAEKRFSRPLGYGERVTEDGVGSGDVASRDEGDAASSDVTQMSAKGPWGKRSGWSKNGAANDVGIGPKAAAVLGVLSEDEIGVSDTEGPSPSGADLLEDRTVSTGGGTRSDAPSLSDASMPSDGGRVPDAADTSFDSRDASIETMAASLGMYQDAGPDSKVSTFEAPRARRGPETSSQGGAGSAEVRGVEESRSGGGWLGQKVARVGLDGGLDLEEAVKRAISEHTGTETRAKKGAGRGGGISKAMAESLEALKKGKAGLGGMAEMAGKGRKGKKRKGTQEKDGAKADGGLVDTESAGTSLAGSEASEKRPGTGGENVMVGSDRAVSEALFGNWKNATSGRPANSFLNQAIAANAAQREENPAPSDLLTSAKIEGLGEADGVETASQPEGEASSERLLAAEPRSTSPKAGHPGRSETVADSSKPADPAPDPDQPSSSAEVSRNADQPGSAADISNLHSSAQPVNPEPSKPSGSAADSPNSESVTEANGQPSPNAPRKKGDYPDWMPHFLDKLHPDSPNFDPEAYAKTHPIKRALMDDDAAGRFPDFSLEALAAPAPELSRVPEDETFAPEHSSEDNRINEALNISEEQRGRVLEAANAAEFDPAAYDKSAPPWEAFRGFGTGARDMEGWDAEGQVNLPEGEQEFEIPTNGGGTRKVKIPADGFKSEQELIDAFGGKSFAIPLDVWNVDLGTYPYMADNFDTVADDDVLEEVPPPDIPPEDKAMQLKVENLAYSLRDFLAMDRDPEADPFKKGLVNSFVTFEDPLHCFTSALLLEDWLDLFARNGYPPSLDFIWYEADPAHRWKRWVYTTLTITLPKDLKKQLEDWGAQGWYEAELGDGPEPEPERPEQRKYEGDEAFRKVLRKAGIAPMKEKEKPLVLETFSKFEMDEAGKITSVYSTWEDFEEEEEPSTPRMRAKRRLFMAALLRKEWGR